MPASLVIIGCNLEVVNLFCKGQKMALVSQTGPSHSIRTEIVRYKAGKMVVVSMTYHMKASKMKELCGGFLSSSCNSSKKEQILCINDSGFRCNRGHRIIVAASPPAEDAVIARGPLTKEDLVDYLASGCKPKEKWRCNYQFYTIFS